MVVFDAGRRRATSVRIWTLAVGTAAGLGLGLSCNVEPGSSGQFAAHCSDDNGDLTCQGAHRGKPFCSLCVGLEEDQGCVASLPVPACRADGGTLPGDGGTDGDGEGSTTTGDDGGSSSEGSATVAVDDTIGDSSSGTSGVTTCDTAGGIDPDCELADPTQPFCEGGECTGCVDAGGDAFCGGLDVAMPACDAALGTCVPCFAVERSVCGESEPFCDAVGGSCLACVEHSQCADTACHAWPEDPLYGTCFPDDSVVWVDANAICPGMGTQANPSCNLAAAVAAFGADEVGVVRLIAGTPYAEDIVMSEASTVAIIGVGAPQVVSSIATDTPSFRVTGGGVLYLAGIRVRDNPTSSGISCANSAIIASDCEIAANDRWGVVTTAPCDVELRRTTTHHNRIGGLRMLGGALALDNTTIAENGDGISGPGIVLYYADVRAVYSTIAGNDAFGPDSMTCEGDVAGEIRNSIITGVSNQSVDLDCFSVTLSHNALDTTGFGGATNVQVPAYNSIYFADPADGDYQLSAPPLTPFGGIALWQEGDPLLDADGTARPLDGAMGYAGIDEP